MGMYVDLKTVMFSAKKDLVHWNGYKVGMKGPNGVVSKMHPNNVRAQKATVSTIALAIDKLIDGNLRTLRVVGNPMAYVEYTRSDGTIVPGLVRAHGGEFYITTNTTFQDYITPAFVYTAILANKLIEDEVQNFIENNLDDLHPDFPVASTDENKMLTIFH